MEGPEVCMAPKRGAKKTAGNATARGEARGFSEDERAAMRERAAELKREARGGRTGEEAALLEAIARLRGTERTMAERLHALVMASAPALSPKTWYGMPAWARDGKVLCYFQSAQKFKTRYATFGFSDTARLDDGAMWPVAFALEELTGADEERIAALVRRAMG
jgi:uncharacterized protein YdhG (YjbR/CyaY superfamily)